MQQAQAQHVPACRHVALRCCGCQEASYGCKTVLHYRMQMLEAKHDSRRTAQSCVLHQQQIVQRLCWQVRAVPDEVAEEIRHTYKQGCNVKPIDAYIVFKPRELRMPQPCPEVALYTR